MSSRSTKSDLNLSLECGQNSMEEFWRGLIPTQYSITTVCCHANVSVYLLLMFSVCVSVFQKNSLRFSLHGLRKPGMISTGEI